MQIDINKTIQQNWREDLQKSDLKLTQIRQMGNYHVYFNDQLVQNKRQSDIGNQLEINESVYIEFDEQAFNFNKIDENQILLNLQQDTPVIMNISPLFKQHSILVPFIKDNLPQIISADLLSIVFNYISPENSDIRLFYNSIGANASVNHLHFHIITMDNVGFEKFPLENANLKIILEQDDIQIFETKDYPIKSIKLKGQRDQMLNYMQILLETLQLNTIAHNILITKDCIYIIPRVCQTYQNYLNDQIRCAIIEVLGIAVVRSQETYDGFTQQDFENILQEISLDDTTFDNIINELFIPNQQLQQ